MGGARQISVADRGGIDGAARRYRSRIDDQARWRAGKLLASQRCSLKLSGGFSRGVGLQDAIDQICPLAGHADHE